MNINQKLKDYKYLNKAKLIQEIIKSKKSMIKSKITLLKD